MNLRYKELLMMAALLVAVSCKKKNKDVIELQPDKEIGALFVEFNPDEVYTVHMDSTISSNQEVDRHLVGTLNDPILGSITASAFGELVLAETNLEIEDTDQYLSVELHLTMDYHQGSDDDTLAIDVKRIDQKINTKEKYYTFDDVTFDDDLGSFTVHPDDLNSQLVYPLLSTFGLSLFSQKSDVAFENQENFRTYLPGIALIPKSGNSIVGFDVESSFVRLNYKSGNDTISKDFSFDGDYHFNSIISDKTGTVVSSLTTNKSQLSSTDLSDRTFVQGGTRLNTRAVFNDLADFLEEENISIFRAELEVQVDPLLDPSPILYLYNSDSTNFEFENDLFQFNVGLGSDVGYVLLKDSKYTFQITDYLQRSVIGLRDFNDFMFSISPNGDVVDQLILNNPKNNINIRIYYTEL